MQPEQRQCAVCGELITAKRLEALPKTDRCFDCANQISPASEAVPRAKQIASKTVTATVYHLKRYLSNVGQKTDARVLFRTLVRINYLFPDISTTEIIPILIKWNSNTRSQFDHEQIRDLVLEARKWVTEHPGKKAGS
jgi:hypothetical protein